METAYNHKNKTNETKQQTLGEELPYIINPQFSTEKKVQDIEKKQGVMTQLKDKKKKETVSEKDQMADLSNTVFKTSLDAQRTKVRYAKVKKIMYK